MNQIKLRIDGQLKETLQSEAAKNERSMNAEIEHRLSLSVTADPPGFNFEVDGTQLRVIACFFLDNRYRNVGSSMSLYEILTNAILDGDADDNKEYASMFRALAGAAEIAHAAQRLRSMPKRQRRKPSSPSSPSCDTHPTAPLASLP